MDNRYIPGRTKCYQIANLIKHILFNNDRWKLNHNELAFILDIISRDEQARDPNKVPYGQAITAINNVKAVFDEFGTRGTLFY